MKRQAGALWLFIPRYCTIFKIRLLYFDFLWSISLSLSQIVFASILERIFLHTIPTSLSIIGTTLILFSALCVAVCFPPPLSLLLKPLTIDSLLRPPQVMKEGKLKEGVKLERDPLLPARDAEVEGRGLV